MKNEELINRLKGLEFKTLCGVAIEDIIKRLKMWESFKAWGEKNGVVLYSDNVPVQIEGSLKLLMEEWEKKTLCKKYKRKVNFEIELDDILLQTDVICNIRKYINGIKGVKIPEDSTIKIENIEEG